jgi:hypothetical protein
LACYQENPSGIQVETQGLRVPRHSEAEAGGTSYPGLHDGISLGFLASL